jgi:ATP synthase protein I
MMLFDFKKNRIWTENTSIVMQLGLTMAGSILLFLFIGLKLDKWLNTRGLFTVIFILLGIVGGGVTVYRQIMATFPSEENKNSPDESDGPNESD